MSKISPNRKILHVEHLAHRISFIRVKTVLVLYSRVSPILQKSLAGLGRNTTTAYLWVPRYHIPDFSLIRPPAFFREAAEVSASQYWRPKIQCCQMWSIVRSFCKPYGKGNLTFRKVKVLLIESFCLRFFFPRFSLSF